MSFLLIGLGALAVWALTRGRGNRPPAPAAPAAPNVPAPAPTSDNVIVIPEQDPIVASDNQTHDGGTITPPDDMGPAAASELAGAGLPPEILAVVRMGGSASDADLMGALQMARSLGRTALAAYFQGRLDRRAAAIRAQREGERDIGNTLPTPRASREVLRALALRVNTAFAAMWAGGDSIGQTVEASERVDALVAEFQRAAGLRTEDGYTEQTATAVSVYGQIPREDVERGYGRSMEYVPPAPRDVPIPVQSFQPDALPSATADRAELQRLATRLADNLRRSAPRAYDRSLLIRFQTAAGLHADGKYGRQSANALGLYGRLPAGQVPAPQY